MSESGIGIPFSALYAGNGCLPDSEVGGYLSLRASRPLHPFGYRTVNASVQSNMRSVANSHQMIGIHAGSYFTKVMNVHSLWKRTVGLFVKDAMSFFSSKHWVTTMQRSRPEPARRREAGLLNLESWWFLACAVASDVVQWFSFYVSGTLTVHRGERGFLAAATLAKTRGVVDITAYGPGSITALKVGGCH